MKKEKVLVAMSGGIDSSVAAILLLEQGYELEGVTFRTWDYISSGCLEKQTGCCSVDSIMEAKHLAEKLGFPHHILDIRNTFEKEVIQNFVDEYLSGRTPNPCVVCNSHIKWGKILEKADELNCKYIATGHYARIRQENSRFVLSKGVDSIKDQSYFLWNLTQENLSRTLFPLGEYNKDEIRKIAAERGFVKLSEKRESQEICFIPDNDYRKFLLERLPDLKEKYKGGKYLSTDGKQIGTHEGFPFYTIGQRKGLGIALGFPAFVTKIDAENNQITIGTREDLDDTEMKVRDINLIKYDSLPSKQNVLVKIRYRNEGSLAEITSKDNYAEIRFINPVSAITPGQSAVFYENDDVIGGGIIV
ncbi:MAG: tRNA 2-thiouridine(34) synthase MnmA [Bacteroidales bacterium]|nr:tRNA 2-thiouridine(34) synthase MnmA [Bacteroidales bacterium]